MYKIICALTAVFLFNTVLHAQATNGIDSDVVMKNTYRHYTGTIGGHSAVMDLRYGFEGAGSFGGSTYYIAGEPGLHFFTIKGPAAYSHSKVFNAQVFPENIPLSDIGSAYSTLMQTIRFDFTFSHDSITGKLFNPANQDQLTISLKEDKNDLPFVLTHAADSVTAKDKKNEVVKAEASYTGIEPGRKMKQKEVSFINDAVARFMNGDNATGDGGLGIAQTCLHRFFAAFNAAASKGKLPGGSDFNGIFMLFPVYTSNGFLVLQQSGYQYDFDNGVYTDQSRYLCLDVKKRKTLQVDNILVQNNALLKTLLERAFRKKYQLEPGKKLSDLFISDTMPLTNNIILVNKGLIFSYSPTKIFHEDQDITDQHEMRLFLSFDELGSMLQPEFKERAGIK